MAKQAGYIKLEGTLGDLTFYKNRDGKFIARRKGGVTKKRIQNDPRFQRTRENLKEFAEAASSAKFLKNAFREIELKSNGGKLHNRLYSMAMKVVKSDPLNSRGERKFDQGDMNTLLGFDFSEKAVLNNVLKVKPKLLDEPGSLSVTIPELVPTKYLLYSQGSKFYRFSLIRAGIDFAQQDYSTEITSIAPLPINNQSAAEVTLTLPKPGIEGEKYFFALALEFFLDVNGSQYDMNDVSQNPAVILAVS
ncbi:hypothetical protein [Algoriphagus persicinus]|uniref:hypothetical protein n=1 Tax=Algoriphagus persicinus TaxID=3108754 RepID=UPI002B3B84F3|nr:hypothetical protein [Algoriphagus sp. E1-3-M2]MEB2787181.1 hypothetical protein [Algoriphagus sp. E1-3-M2]